MYHGIAQPSPYKVGTTWIINDVAFGYFTGASPSSVLAEWGMTVDEFLLNNAMATGRYGPPFDDDRFMCNKCGSVVANIFIHDDWHKS